jgi:hypothetical protein
MKRTVAVCLAVLLMALVPISVQAQTTTKVFFERYITAWFTGKPLADAEVTVAGRTFNQLLAERNKLAAADQDFFDRFMLARLDGAPSFDPVLSITAFNGMLAMRTRYTGADKDFYEKYIFTRINGGQSVAPEAITAIGRSFNQLLSQRRGQSASDRDFFDIVLFAQQPKTLTATGKISGDDAVTIMTRGFPTLLAERNKFSGADREFFDRFIVSRFEGASNFDEAATIRTFSSLMAMRTRY